MQLLEEYITKYGEALSEHVLKVDAFLNHQIDPELMMALGKDFCEQFKDKNIDKIITIETSGIAPALMCGYIMEVPVVFIKKSTSRILQDDCYQSEVHSFTKNIDYTIHCSKNYVKKGERVLFIDDFMANGDACLATLNIIHQAEASVEGIGIVIEKAFQGGRKKLEDLGYSVYSQARIQSLKKGSITFLK